jgi:NitT/TauT family transport system substrate-binding protein
VVKDDSRRRMASSRRWLRLGFVGCGAAVALAGGLAASQTSAVAKSSKPKAAKCTLYNNPPCDLATLPPGYIVPTPKQAGINPKHPTTITMLLVPYFGLEHIASARGIFQKYGLVVNFVPTLQGLAGLPAVVTGQAQTMQSNLPYNPLVAGNEGTPVEDVVAGYSANGYDVVRCSVLTSSGITTPADMIGKTMGEPSVNGYYTAVFAAWLKTGGVSISQIHQVAVPAPSEAQALESGQVQAVCQGDIYYTAMFNQEHSAVTRVTGDSTPGIIPDAQQYDTGYPWVTSYVNAHPAVVRAFVASLLAAYKYVTVDPAGARQAISTVSGVDVDDIPLPSFPPGLCVSEKAMAAWIPLSKQLGFIPSTFNPAPTTMFTNKFNPNCTANGTYIGTSKKKK